MPVVSLSKGLEQGTRLRMTQVLEAELPGHPCGVLTGPNLAKEILAGDAAATVIAMDDPVIAEALQDIFANDLFRVYTNPDVIGCEVAGALKNVMAIASGMADGLGTGDNTRSAVITRGLAELTRLGCAMGGQQVTFAGLAGMGDLIATCISSQSRNRYVGEQLGRGRTIEEVIDEMHMVAEGVKTSKVVMELAHEYEVSMPIAREVHRVVHEGSTRGGRVPGSARPARRAGRDARHAQLLIRWRACASGPAPRVSRGTTGCSPAGPGPGPRSGTSTHRGARPWIRPGSSPSPGEGGRSTGGSAPRTAGTSRPARRPCASPCSATRRWWRRACACRAGTRCTGCTRPVDSTAERRSWSRCTTTRRCPSPSRWPSVRTT